MLAFDFVHCRLPPYCRLFFQTWCPTKLERSISLRPNTSKLIRLPKPNTCLIHHSPMYSAISLWNSLPNAFRTINARTTFHSALKEHSSWVYVHLLIFPPFLASPEPCSLSNRCLIDASNHLLFHPPPPPQPPSPSLLDTSFYTSPFTLAVLLGYWARVDNNNNSNNNNSNNNNNNNIIIIIIIIIPQSSAVVTFEDRVTMISTISPFMFLFCMTTCTFLENPVHWGWDSITKIQGKEWNVG